MSQAIKLAVYGVNTLLGKAFIKQLEQAAQIEIDVLYPICDEIDETDSSVRFDRRHFPRVKPEDFDWQQASIVVFADSAERTLQWADMAMSAGCRVIDGSHAEIVGSLLADAHSSRHEIYTSGAPLHSATATSLMLSRVLGTLQRDVGIESVAVTSLQSVSHAGQSGVDELAGQTARLLNGLPVTPEVFGAQIAFNLHPSVGKAIDGVSVFEQQIEDELTELLGDASTQVTVQALQLPIFFGECAAVKLRTRYGLSRAEVIDLLEAVPGVRIDLDSVVTLVGDLNGESEISVSRLRHQEQDPELLTFILQADSLNGGLATNLVALVEQSSLYQL
jgi:aspartate-semialdehyde dehydrogenase